MFSAVMRDAEYAAYRVKLKEWLGIPIDATDNQIHEQIVAGFPTSRLIVLSEQGYLSLAERNQIIPLRILKIRLGKNQLLITNESDRLFRNVHITAMAETIFGAHEKAKRWLTKPERRFNGETPMAMLLTTQGTRQVEEMLVQVVEG